MTVNTSLLIIIGGAAIGCSYSTLRAQSPRSIWDGVYTAEQARARSSTLYPVLFVVPWREPRGR